MPKEFVNRDTATRTILLLIAEIGVLALSRGKFLKQNRKTNKEIIEQLSMLSGKISQKIFELSSRKLISRKFTQGNLIEFRLTQKGKEIVKRFEFANLRIVKQEKWDRQWRIIAYDIPAENNKASIALARKLHQLGLHRLQKSLWVFPWDFRDELTFICEMLSISEADCICYFTTGLIPRQKEIIKLFELS
jgi:DNA-binding transcriptional regulator PaaX